MGYGWDPTLAPQSKQLRLRGRVCETVVANHGQAQLQYPLSNETRFYHRPGVFHLESGETLEDVQVGYRTWGEPRSEAILICHALTGSADADEWWEGLFGPNRSFDPDHDFVIASNVLGGCYGTTGPISLRPRHGPLVRA